MVSFSTSEARLCPACFNNKFQDEQLIPGLVVSKCLRCDLLTSTIAQPKNAESEFDRVDESAYQAGIGQVRKEQAQKIISLVSQYDYRKVNWVDIGCGFGFMLNEAKNAGYKIFGVEPSEQAYEISSSLLGKDIIYRGLLTENILENESTDVISLLDVLEHIAINQLESFVQMILKKSRTGGLLVVKVPSTEGLYFQVAHKLLPLTRVLAPGIFKRLWQTSYEYPHTVYFNGKNLSLLLKQYGFEILELRYLEEVPTKTILNRLLLDNTISKPLAYLIALASYALRFIEKFREKTDALVIVARKPG